MKGFFSFLPRVLAVRIQLFLSLFLFFVFVSLGIILSRNLESILSTWHEVRAKNVTDLVVNMADLYRSTAARHYLSGLLESVRKNLAYQHSLVKQGKLKEKEAWQRIRELMLDPANGLTGGSLGKNGYLAGLSGAGRWLLHPVLTGEDAGEDEFVKTLLRLKDGYLDSSSLGEAGGMSGGERLVAFGYFAPWDVIVCALAYRQEIYSLVERTELIAKIRELRLTPAAGGAAGAGAQAPALDTDHAFIIDGEGNIIAHPSLAGQNIAHYQDKEGKPYIREILEHREGKLTYLAASANRYGAQKRLAYYKPLADNSWLVVTSFSMEGVTAAILWGVNLIRLILTTVFVVMNVLLLFLLRRLLKPVYALKKLSGTVSQGDLTRRLEIQSPDEVGEISRQFNHFITGFEEVIYHIKETISALQNTIQSLSASSQEVSTTSNQQAAAVKEIVSSMEDSDKLAKTLLDKIKGVSQFAVELKTTVTDGFEIIKNSFKKMDEIRLSNIDTINGIQLLSEKVENIWEIMNIINGIADETKIIAFNAELEASAAGEAGKSFQIVATEIRKLADNTVSSINDIKVKIDEIQYSSDHLIIASEEGTRKIKDGWSLASNLQKVFEDILHLSEVASGSAAQIATSLQQQVSAFEQILLTLKQISEGIDQFVLSLEMTGEESEHLQSLAEDLNAIIDKYLVGPKKKAENPPA